MQSGGFCGWMPPSLVCAALRHSRWVWGQQSTYQWYNLGPVGVFLTGQQASKASDWPLLLWEGFRPAAQALGVVLLAFRGGGMSACWDEYQLPES